MENQKKDICDCNCEKTIPISSPMTFNAILKFWKKRQWYYEKSTNFNVELYFNYLKAINNDI